MMSGMVDNDLDAVFERAGCHGTLLVEPLDGGAGIALRPDEPVVPASVVKVPIALEAETWFADGRLDPRERVTLPADGRTPGPVGLSLFSDDVTLSWRDMVVLMLTISDNPCTDALSRRIGLDAVNATMARLGLAATHVVSDLSTMLDSIGQDLGGAGYRDMLDRLATAPPEEMARADAVLPTARAFTPATATRTTARDMVTLLRLIWTDAAGPPAACRRVRDIMARQLTRHRIAAGFGRPVTVAAKSGGLLGILRNEIGVITFPDGARYAAAVFTRTAPGTDDRAVNAAIGTATARAVATLREEC